MHIITCKGLCLILGLLALAHAAKNPLEDSSSRDSEWLSELRRVPQATIDATGKFHTLQKDFERHDRETGEYTRLVYNCTQPVNHFIDLDTQAFAVKAVTCDADELIIESSTSEGNAALRAALLQSSSGLILTRAQWGCRSSITGDVAPAFRSFWAPAWDAAKNNLSLQNSATATVALKTVDSAPSSFLHTASFSFFSNHSSVAGETKSRQSGADNKIYFKSVPVSGANYNAATGAAFQNIISVRNGPVSKIECENCYMRTNQQESGSINGAGIEMDVNGGVTTFVRLWFNGGYVVSANMIAEVRHLLLGLD
jgi:hypothetical protein